MLMNGFSSKRHEKNHSLLIVDSLIFFSFKNLFQFLNEVTLKIKYYKCL